MSESESYPDFILSKKQFVSFFKKPPRKSGKKPISVKKFIDLATVTYSKPCTVREAFKRFNGTMVKDNRKKRSHNKKESENVKNSDEIVMIPDYRTRYECEIISYFYEILVNNPDVYLGQFYDAYFKFTNHDKLNWKKVEIEDMDNNTISLQKNDASKRVVRNLHFLDILLYTKVTNTMKCQYTFWESLKNLFLHYIIPDRMFCPSCLELMITQKNTTLSDKVDGEERVPEEHKKINYNTLFYLFQQYQPKAFIMNPYILLWLIEYSPWARSSGKKLKLFSPVTGVSYMMAYLQSSRYNEYVAIDVNTRMGTQSKNYMLHYQENGMFNDKDYTFYNKPSEKVRVRNLIHDDSDKFDTIIWHPPYFRMELYQHCDKDSSSHNQSTNKYVEYSAWIDGYIVPTMKLCYKTLKSGGILYLIVSNYNTLDGKSYDIVNDMNDLFTECRHLEKIVEFDLVNRTSPLRVNKKKRLEKLLIWRGIT